MKTGKICYLIHSMIYGGLAARDPQVLRDTNAGIYLEPPVFHAVTSNHNRSFPVLRLLLENGADLRVKANIRVPVPEGGFTLLRDVTPRQYAARCPNDFQPGPGSGPEMGLDNRPHRNVLELLA